MDLSQTEILIIEDDPQNVSFFRQLLFVPPANADPARIHFKDSLIKALNTRFPRKPHVILLDLSLPVHEAQRALVELKRRFLDVPLIVMMDAQDEEQALALIRKGVQDYFVREEMDSHLFCRMIRYSIERMRIRTKTETVSQERFRYLIENTSDGLVVVNEKGLVQFINPAAEEILGLDGKKILGQPFPCPVSPDKAQEIERVRAHDEKIFLEVKSRKILWEGVKAYLVSLHDITLLKKMDLLKAQILEREKMDHIKDEFLSTVSHEMRTPLTIVKGAISNLKVGVVGELSEKQRRVLEIASNNTDRLARIINDLLDLSRLESGKSKISLAAVNVKALIEEQIHHFQFLLQDKAINVTYEGPEELPDVYADKDLITQVLVNLLGNAQRYAQSHIHVRVTYPITPGEWFFHQEVTQPLHDYLKICIYNDGPLIPEEQKGELFNKFVQLNRPAGGAGYKGTGLGLAICLEIVMRHAGMIGVENRENGPEFCFALPVYHKEKDVVRQVDDLLTQADAVDYLSVVAVRVKNWADLLKACGLSFLGQKMKDLIIQIETTLLRGADLLQSYDDRTLILVLPYTSQAGVAAFVKRLEDFLKKIIFEYESMKLIPQFDWGVVSFPEEASSAQALIHEAVLRSLG